MNAKKTILFTAALAVLTLVSAAHAQIAFRNWSSASISGGGGTPVAPALRSWSSAVLKAGPARFYLHGNPGDVNPTTRGNWRDGGLTCCWAVADNNNAASSKYRFGKLTLYKHTSGGQPALVARTLIDVNPGHVMVQKMVSEPLPMDQTISGTLNWILMQSESNAGLNAYHQLHVYVLREPDTVVGTLMNNYAELSTSGNEWGTGATCRGPAGGTAKAVTAVAAQAGDRIVIEAGFVAYSTSANNTNNYFGGTVGVDATVSTCSFNPVWFEFSQDLFGNRINKPAGTVAGDVMIASIAVAPNTATINPPLGWTFVDRIDDATSTSRSLAIYRRTADASDSSLYSYVWTTSGATAAVGSIRTFSG